MCVVDICRISKPKRNVNDFSLTDAKYPIDCFYHQMRFDCTYQNNRLISVKLHCTDMPDILFAFDRQTARSIDADGRMRVKNCVLSVAEVNPYYGKEIPGSDKLGLRADQVYEMYRDPDELKKAVKTFEGLPLMIKHVAQTAENPRKEYVGGSVHNVTFAGREMRGDLMVWDGEAIDLIDSEELADLSCSYRYKPVMTSGTVSGTKYDGVMTDIQGNHVALVDDGRASGAHVADAAIKPKMSDQSTQGAESMAFDNPQPAAAPAAPAAAAAPAPGSPAGEQNEQANMAMIGAALKQIGVILQDIHSKLPAAAAPAPAPAAAAPPAGDADVPNAGTPPAQAEGEQQPNPAGAADFELEPAVPNGTTLQGANDEELIGPESGETVAVPPSNPDGTPSRGDAPATPVIGAMDAKSVSKLVNIAVLAERKRVAELGVAKDEVRYVLGDVAMDSAADVYRAALIQSGVPEADIPKGSEKAAWQGYRSASAIARGGVVPELANMANDAAMKKTNTAHLSALVSKISVKG